MQVNSTVTELKSDAVKERHWKSLMKQLRVRWTLSELTLGQVWDVDLEKNDKVVRDVLLVAQGERALEEFLRQVNESTTRISQVVTTCKYSLYDFQENLVYSSLSYEVSIG